MSEAVTIRDGKFLRAKERGEGKGSERFSSLLKKALRVSFHLLILSFFLFLGHRVYAHLLEDPLFRVREVDVGGCEKLSRETLLSLAPSLTPDGIFIIDDGYFEDGSPYKHPIIRPKSEIFGEIAAAGMEVIDEVIIREEDIEGSDTRVFENLQARCLELAEAHPDKKHLFLDYIKRQMEENAVLEKEAACATLVIRRRPSPAATAFDIARRRG